MKRGVLGRLALLLGAVFLSGTLFAQQVTVKGKVTDAADGSPIPGANIAVKGKAAGTISDPNGNYSLSVNRGDTLVFMFVGYTTKEVVVQDQTVINVALHFSEVSLKEVVAIGYGTVKKEDATGSVAAVTSEDFNRGAITSPQDLVSGKIAGVQITNAGGAPGAGAMIRIRGGSSLSASNDPLIVIDGVPVDNEGVAGMRNPLNTINPEDIETFTVLKDASATAIYGSRASNGVIIITTKKGKEGQPFSLTYNGKVSWATRSGQISVLSTDQFRNIIQDRYADNPNAINLMGTESTDWQDVIFKTAFAQDHDLSFTGGIKKLPYRFSLGYTNQDGILRTSGLNRTTGALNLSPSFFHGDLKVIMNVKGMIINNQFADWGAIGSAVSFDPTQPVYDANSPYGGYFTWVQPNGDPITIAPANPLALLNMQDNHSKVSRSLGNLQLNYRLPFLRDLTAKLNLGYDVSKSDGNNIIPENASWTYDPINGGGRKTHYTQNKRNSLLDFYFNYVKDLSSISSHLDITAGYSWQHYWRKGTDYSTNYAGSKIFNDSRYATENYLISFFGRLNYIFKDRYMLTFTLRDDGSSRFAPENRWGLFPSVALAWDIAKENFIKGDVLNTLKLRLGYGITGQQDIGGDYPYLPRYTYSLDNAQYQFGNTFITTLRPEGYDENLKWEQTTTYNVGLDYGFLNNRISGSLDAYYRKTTDLLNFIPVPAGTNLTNQILTNVGDLYNKGIEFGINGTAISKKDMKWDIGFNVTYNKNRITKLTATSDPNYLGVFTGGISGGVGNNIQIHSVGYPANSFFVYEQVYDENGKPIEGLYVDRNGDGQITVDDRYHYEKPAPDVFMGFTSMFTWKDLDFSFAGRISLGNYVYNNMFSNYGTYSTLYNSVGYLSNVTTSLLDTHFENPKYFSDYYVENGSFLRMDHITLGYTFNNIKWAKLRIYGTVQNPFLITKYDGLDPEVANGIDNNVYPRPRTFLFGVSAKF